MIVKYTAADRKKFNEIFEERDRLLAENEELIASLRDPNDTPKYPKRKKIPDNADEDEINTIRKQNNEDVKKAFNDWINSGSEEWREAREERSRIISLYMDKLNAFSDQIELREFNKLGGDRDAILSNARDQVDLMLENRYDSFERTVKTGVDSEGNPINAISQRGIRVESESGEFYLDREENIEDARRGLLHLHYDALKYDADAIKQLDDIVISEISKNPHVSDSLGVLGGRYEIDRKEINKGLLKIKTSRPDSYISTVDKVSGKAFEGIFDMKPTAVEVIKKTKVRRPIRTMVTIDYSELEGVKISGRRELNAFDREVHDAILTLYIEGGNTFITVNMIYQTMTGKENAHCSAKQAEAISESVTKLMLSHVVIDATAEAQIDKRLNKARYDSTMINAKRLTISMNGQTVEAIKVTDTPILYDYASQKNQIGRFDMRLLNTPSNKTEETLVIEGYLRRRISQMKGSKKPNPTILYETIYKQIGLVKETYSSPGAYRKKALKVRNVVKSALDYFKQEGFITGYVENAHKNVKNSLVSVTVRY